MIRTDTDRRRRARRAAAEAIVARELGHPFRRTSIWGTPEQLAAAGPEVDAIVRLAGAIASAPGEPDPGLDDDERQDVEARLAWFAAREPRPSAIDVALRAARELVGNRDAVARYRDWRCQANRLVEASRPAIAAVAAVLESTEPLDAADLDRLVGEVSR